jgi:Zn-dependent peptidase ImmA (M78 family)
MAIRKSGIQTIVEEILVDSGVAEAPVPLPRIIKSRGLRIVVDSLQGDLWGFLYRGPRHAVIGVNTHHPLTRQNFTLAHEFGHYLLHDQERFHADHEFRVRFRRDVSSQGSDEAELEANFFAVSLLMPRKLVEKDIQKQGRVDLLDEGFLSKLARQYIVSIQALVGRLRELAYVRG